MPTFAINEGTFDLPEDWDDRSVTAISYPAGSNVPVATITVTREKIKDPQETLASYVHGQLAKLARTCSAFQLLKHTPTYLNGAPADAVEFTWNTPEKIAIRQVMVITFWRSQSLVVTSTSAVDRFAEFQPVFEGILASFRIRT